MAEIIEISVFKIISIITGILSLVLAWTSVSFQGEIFLMTINISADYNFIGYVTRMKLGTTVEWYPGGYSLTLLTVFGLFYLIGFLLTLINIKIDEKELYITVGKIGLLFVIIGFFGYVFSFLGLFYQNLLIIDEEIYSLYTFFELNFIFNAGFYFAIVSLIMILFELFLKNQRYVIIKHSIPQEPLGAREIIVRGRRKENLEGIPCPFCGAKISFESAKFCLECGASLR